ncbi:MAG: NAD-glutamate dehydrogenase [Syntrophotaleaceae bacterium]
MKIRVDRGEDPRGEFEKTLESALDLLRGVACPDRIRRLQQLTVAFRFNASPSFTSGRSLHRIAELLNLFLDFIESRTSSAEVRLLPADRPGRSLLLTCSSDIPFLFDAVQTFLKKTELRFEVLAHPLVFTRPAEDGRMLTAERAEGAERNSFMVFTLSGFLDAGEETFVEGLRDGIVDLVHLESEREQLDSRLASLQAAAAQEGFSEFWSWLRAGNFRPFSYRCLLLRELPGGECWVREEPGSALGMPSHPRELKCCESHPLAELNPLFRDQLIRPAPVVVFRTERPSPIHWRENLSYLGFRERTVEGWREHAFLGVFPPRSAHQSNWDIPPLQQRIRHALDALGILPDSHDFRKTVDLLNTFPKVELFFMEPSELQQVARNFTLLYRYEAVRIVAVPSLAVEGLTLVVMMPRDFYSAETVQRLEAYLGRRCGTSFVEARVIQISGDFVSLHVRLGNPEGRVCVDLGRLESGLTRIFRPWTMKLRHLLEKKFGFKTGYYLWQRYRSAFSREYQALVHPRFALRDVREVENVQQEKGEIFALWGPLGGQGEFWRLQFYSDRESSLNEILPILENFGLAALEDVDFEVIEGSRRTFIKSFSIRPEIDVPGGLQRHREMLTEALAAVRKGKVENDLLNRMLLACGLSWRQIDVFRGYRNYYLQLGAPFSRDRIALALIRNPHAAYLLFRYFEARFGPVDDDSDSGREGALSPLREELSASLEQVADINEDRILRAFFNFIDATVRTNFFLRGQRDHPLSFKIGSLGIIDMPAPRPLYEIFVHSAAMEGIHLRGGVVSRGGIRLSDRLDFRTEILDLMKTQVIKNALIVPTGSKGGFVLKREGGGLSGAAVAAYREFIRGLLDLTDNRIAGRVVHPPGLVVHDGDDPYLVVAADKGTAHLSDEANRVAAGYAFWLGDAFASGGSHGYDHKKLGITARGAWIAVRRHFRELGVDIQKEPFTVIGIGDMSGDVFGNGLLQSDKIRLQAAFNHRHIFLDPDPDPALSYAERLRLFKLPQSSWTDYDPALLSSGGGVFSRDAKEIPLSDEVRRFLGCRYTSIDGPGLIRLILTAKADLLWNGGIGTYVKSSTESHQDVGDRGNDAVRVDGGRLRVRVVAEGGNLGFTQRGRIEYALTGGRINIDAVDNSGGVDCSDHEVNIKILLQQLQEQESALAGERDRLLEDLTDEVCASVLENCYQQNLCLSLDVRRCEKRLESFFVLTERLENAGRLDPQIEHLPAPKAVLARPGKAFTRPELAVLMAFAKIDLIDDLLESDLPDIRIGADFLAGYFPAPLRRRFRGHLGQHPLRREIAATAIGNTIVNQAGSSFISRIWEQTGAPAVKAVKTYLTYDLALRGPELRRQVRSLGGLISAEEELALLEGLESVLEYLSRWSLVQRLEAVPEKELIESLQREIAEYDQVMETLLSEDQRRERSVEEKRLEQLGFPAGLARRAARLSWLDGFLPVASMKRRTGGDFSSLTRLFNRIRTTFALPEILRMLAGVPIRHRWDRMARQKLEVKLDALAFELSLAVWDTGGGDLKAFLERRPGSLQNYRSLLSRLREGVPGNCHPFTVLAGALEAMLAAE